MNERLIVKSFGPVRNLDITFRKVTVIIGDQGTGKSCVAKLFSIFKWLEKQFISGRQKPEYYCRYNRFNTKLCAYHRLEAFFREQTYLSYDSEFYSFVYEQGALSIKSKKEFDGSLAKICYVPAERSILSVAENRQRLLKELPDSSTDFHDMFCDAKRHFMEGYDLPFGGLRYTYDQLNGISKVYTSGIDESVVKLSHSSSGVQSALPMLLVSQYLTDIVIDKSETRLTKEEKERMAREIDVILSNADLTDTVKELMVRRLSEKNRYGAFINIAEEPELNLFPMSQYEVILSLVKNCFACVDNMLVVTTHSPYVLAIFNLLVLASKTFAQGREEEKTQITEVVPMASHIPSESLGAYSIKLDEGSENCTPLVNPTTGLIGKNDLDAVSGEITRKFNMLYRYYGQRN